jgi:hypothetical protein
LLQFEIRSSAGNTALFFEATAIYFLLHISRRFHKREYRASDVGMTGKDLEGCGCCLNEVLSQHSPGENRENHDKP